MIYRTAQQRVCSPIPLECAGRLAYKGHSIVMVS